MVVECLVIVAILFAMVVLFWKVKRDQAVAVVPLLILPAANVLAHFFVPKFVSTISFGVLLTYIFVIIMAVIISSVLVGVFSARLGSRHNKIGYFIMSVAFNIALAIVLINNIFTIYM